MGLGLIKNIPVYSSKINLIICTFFHFQPETRLEYKFLENRAFHIALLKYLYLSSNKGCHRTALEIAKVMLNLEPEDPLAVLFVIDTLAIRANEYQWLIDAANAWSHEDILKDLCNERHVKYMFNFMYSKAMAHFHLAYKNQGKYFLTMQFKQ